MSQIAFQARWHQPVAFLFEMKIRFAGAHPGRGQGSAQLPKGRPWRSSVTLLMDERAAVESAAKASSHTRPRPQQTDMRSTDRYLSQKKSG